MIFYGDHMVLYEENDSTLNILVWFCYGFFLLIIVIFLNDYVLCYEFFFFGSLSSIVLWERFWITLELIMLLILVLFCLWGFLFLGNFV